MINRIIDFSVRNRLAVFCLVGALCVAGWWSMRHLPLDELGLFQVTLHRTLCPPGRACRFGVRSLGRGSRRWFGLNLYTDAGGDD